MTVSIKFVACLQNDAELLAKLINKLYSPKAQNTIICFLDIHLERKLQIHKSVLFSDTLYKNKIHATIKFVSILLLLSISDIMCISLAYTEPSLRC